MFWFFGPQGMWDLSPPTIERALPALDGKVLTTAPEKSRKGLSEVAFGL